MRERIYLDHAATTPIRPEAAAAVAEGMARWANPSSPHAEGRAARAALEDARARIAAALNWDGEVILTSGASEALAIALGRAKGGTRYVSAVEHDAVFRAVPDAVVLPVGADGVVDLNDVNGATPVVAVQFVNSETGKIQPVDAITAHVRAAGGISICDCAQSAGRLALPDADMIAVSAHKLGGPPGVGALLVRDLGQLSAGGGQERGYRGGTENLPGALGFAAALEEPDQALVDIDALDWIGDLRHAARQQGADIIDQGGEKAAYIQSIAMPHLSAAAQLIEFDLAGFAVSSGSACSSGSLKPSRALAAFGVSAEVAARTIRVSLGWTSTTEEVRAFMATWLSVAERARTRAA
ncbi:MAG: aminotransferase class V-fold PLP-dependent enzyme [Pseudomonadota bacterium]